MHMYPSIITNSLEINATYISKLLLKSISGELDTVNISDQPEKFNDQIQVLILDNLIQLGLVSYKTIEGAVIIQFNSRFRSI